MVDRPSSRSAHLHDLIKSTSSIAMPTEVRRVPAPKSLREKERREAKMNASTADDQPTLSPQSHQQEDDELEGVKRRKKKSSSRTHKYTKPASLIELESQAELVDLTAIRQLERGFALLERFKTTSAAFESDARGRMHRGEIPDRPTRGIGAFERERPMPRERHRDDESRQDLLEEEAREENVTNKATRIYSGQNTSRWMNRIRRHTIFICIRTSIRKNRSKPQ